MPNTKLKVHLSAEQRAELQVVCGRHSIAAAKARRARVLLMSDEDHSDGRRRDWEIAEAVGISERQVSRIRQQFVREGAVRTIHRKLRVDAGIPKKLDGKVEAQLVMLCCSDAPAGRDHWTLQLLCDELVRLQVVESVCCETVRKRLKKTNSSPGGLNGSASRKKTGLGSSRGWKRSSTSIRKATTRRTR